MCMQKFTKIIRPIGGVYTLCIHICTHALKKNIVVVVNKIEPSLMRIHLNFTKMFPLFAHTWRMELMPTALTNSLIGMHAISPVRKSTHSHTHSYLYTQSGFAKAECILAIKNAPCAQLHYQQINAQNFARKLTQMQIQILWQNTLTHAFILANKIQQ